MDHILSIVLFTPLAGLLVLLLLPSSNARAIKLWANVVAFLGFLVSLPLVFNFDHTKDYQFEEKAQWIPSLGATYHIGIDGLGLLLVMLTTVVGFLAILSSWNAIEHRLKEYYALFLLLQTAMLGVFMALDFLLFFVFWETVLVPMYFIIGIWGGPRRGYAAIKFMIYTLIGSVLMFLGILTLYYQHYTQFQAYSFDIADLMRTQIPEGIEWWVFWAFFVGFAVKVPMFPFHTWLPDAHTEAPTAGSVILAGVLLKLGAYGLIRFAVPLFPFAAHTFAWPIIVLSVVAIVYGAIVSIVQPDLKRLVAYSSVSHMGFVTLGIFTFTAASYQGAVLQMINHGLITGGLFLLVGVIYERTHDRSIAKMGGIAAVMPIYATVFGFFILASAGLPGLSGFVGEFLVFVGSFGMAPVIAVASIIVMVMAATYLLWMFQRLAFGELSEFFRGLGGHLTDLDRTEMITLAPLAFLIVLLGLFPSLVLDLLRAPTQVFLAAVGVGG